MKNETIAAVKVAAVTMTVCCVVYPAVMLGFGASVAPETAAGSLVRGPDGTVFGSTQVAQAFVSPGYFWPRPSAVDYDGAGAGGSNLSPTSPALRERAEELIIRYDAKAERPVPADLVTASGSGLDPHITAVAAEYQAARVADARDLPEERVRALIAEQANPAEGGLAPVPLVNVLELNLALDRVAGTR